MANAKGPTLFGKRMCGDQEGGWYAQVVPGGWFPAIVERNGDTYRFLVPGLAYGKERKSPQAAANDADRYLRRLKGQLERMIGE